MKTLCDIFIIIINLNVFKFRSKWNKLERDSLTHVKIQQKFTTKNQKFRNSELVS